VRRRLALAALLALLAAAAPAAATPTWGWLGVRIRDLSEQEMDDISQKYGLREGFGAVVVEVLKDTPADRSGLRTGDVVVAFRGRPVVDTRTLQRYIASASVGETVPITVLRREEGRQPVSVRIGPMPEAVAAERVAAEYGFFIREPEPQPETGGARPPQSPAVTGVLPKSRADAAGLKVGDEVVEVNGHPVATLAALREQLIGLTPDGPLRMTVRRDGDRVVVSVAATRALGLDGRPGAGR
jgi:serine protease Do